MLCPFDKNIEFGRIEEILKRFEPITLEEMSVVKLMNRIDTKYVIPLKQLKYILEEAAPLYMVQTKEEQRLAPYHTVYLDTPEKTMYNLHQAGRQVRQKIRIRTYLDTDTTFLEVKTKNNHARTKKKRIIVDLPDYSNFKEFQSNLEATSFLNEKSWHDLKNLMPHVENRFNRITLVNRAKTERLTIDLKLSFHNYDTGRDIDFSPVAIIELKRDGLTYSPMRDILLSQRIHEGGFSKYCIGCALTNPKLRQNNFKEKIIRIKHLSQANTLID